MGCLKQANVGASHVIAKLVPEIEQKFLVDQWPHLLIGEDLRILFLDLEL